MLLLNGSDDQRDRPRKALPLRCFLLQSFPSGSGQGVVFGAPAILADVPLRADPAVLFQLVERGVQSALTNLQNFTGHLLYALRDAPAVHLWFTQVPRHH